ncbi:MAG: hypothetical protein ABSE73_29300, partial [Planctomycetota bacterium]
MDFRFSIELPASGDRTVNLKSKIENRKFFLAFLAVACNCAAFLVWAGEGPADNAPKRAEFRLLAAGRRMLLSRGGQPLAAAQLRPATPGPAKLVLSAAEAQAALHVEQASGLPSIAKDPSVAEPSALLLAGEQVREFQFPIPRPNELPEAGGTPAHPGSTGQDTLSVILKAREVAAGARLLFSSAYSGPSRADLAPGEKLPLPAPLELAIQIFPDAAGNLPEATFVDNAREPLPLPPLSGKAAAETAPFPAPAPAPGPSTRRARAWTFETKKDFRVTIARSGPIAWLIQRTPEAVLLTTPLLPDPRESAAFGSFVVYLGAGADEAPPEISPLGLDRIEVPARDFLEGAVRVYAAGANPFILNETAVVAEIACPPNPKGDVPIKRLPCFFWEAPPESPAEGEFRFRFAPPAEGVYGARIVVLSATGQVRGDALAFRAGPPASAGFVKARPGERYFRLDDGTVFIPLGTYQDGVQSKSADEFRKHFIALARHNGNAARIVLSLSGLALEGSEAGQFDPAVAAT